MSTTDNTTIVAQIEGLQVPFGQIALWSLGQSGYVLKAGNTIACIDPYLSGERTTRRFAPPLAPADIMAEVVFATHEHLDHTDPWTLTRLMAASPSATLIASSQGRAIAVGAGIASERVIVPRIGKRNELVGLAYTALPAAHYSYEVDDEGHARWMGFLIEWNGVSLYHSGDTIIFPELLKALEGRTVDLALLPTNGRDFPREQRGIIGNMWPHEAVALAQIVKARVLIGMHNDLFAGNRVSSGLLFDALDQLAPFQRCHVLQPGELYLYAG